MGLYIIYRLFLLVTSLRFIFLSFFFSFLRSLSPTSLLRQQSGNQGLKVSIKAMEFFFFTLIQTYRFVDAYHYGHRRSFLDDMQEGKRSLYFNRLGPAGDLVLVMCAANFCQFLCDKGLQWESEGAFQV